MDIFCRFGLFTQKYHIESISELKDFFKPKYRIDFDVENISCDVRNALDLLRMNINHIIDMIRNRSELEITDDQILDEICDVMDLYCQILTGKKFKFPRPKSYSAMLKENLSC